MDRRHPAVGKIARIKRKVLAGIALVKSQAREASNVVRSQGTLQALGIAHGTDKHNEEHSFDGRSYLDVYETYFSSCRFEPLNVVEIGIKSGASLRMWKSYFPNAHVVGLDIDQACSEHSEERIDVVIGSQDDPDALDRVLDACGGHPDIVVDDGSHITDHILASFRHLFDHVSPGGIYAIEDLGASYEDLSRPEHSEYRRRLNPIAQLENNRDDIDELLLSLLHDLDHETGDVAWIHFWSKMCFIGKRRL